MRALAVLPIVGFHLGFQKLSGGYVGVDIFFVISGYLIGGIVVRDTRADKFSLINFYARRLRRILPALVVMLAITTLAATLILFPWPLIAYGKSLLAAALSISNIYFWQTANYFDSAADAKPLLHTWSLAVEEQFYLLFPATIYWLYRLRIPLFHGISIVAILSFAASVYGVWSNSSETFYLIHTRAWELLIGVLAVQFPDHWLRKRLIREGIAVVSLSCVVATILLYTPATRFPGLAALPPCLGTAGLLVSGRGGPTLIRGLIGIKPVTFFGLISYSLYLWHWPLIVLAKQAIPEGSLRMPERFVVLALSIGLAWLSWKYVERPFRSERISRRALLWGSGLATALACAVGIILAASNGFPNRFSPETARLAGYVDQPVAEASHPCIVGLFATPGAFVADACLRTSAVKPNVLLFGDSHADHLVAGLRAAYPDINFMQATAAGCRTTLAGNRGETTTCRAFRERMFKNYFDKHHPEWVVMANFWGWEGLDQILPTIEWLHARGIRVILVGPVPRYEIPLPLALAAAARRGSEWPILHSRLRDPADLDGVMARKAQAWGVSYLSPFAALCPKGRCLTTSPEGVPLQRDSAHLSAAGSLIVARAFPAQLVQNAARRD